MITPRIVIDTNLFLSVFVFRGKMAKLIFELVLDDKLTLYVSSNLRKELKDKFDHFAVSQEVQQKVMLFLERKGVLVEPEMTIAASRDAKDNFLLEIAESAEAQFLVTRDKDILVLEKWKETVILSPEDFLPQLRKRGILTS
jgi:putative PIN family toxin of toxin-antitoxin system